MTQTIPDAVDEAETFRRKARQILAEGRPVTAGCIHLIGLAEIREELGPRWEVVKERVHDYTRRALERVLSPNDLWFRHGDADYVVVFAKLDKTAAQLVCGKIVANLHDALLGNSDLHKVKVRTAVMRIDGEVLVEIAHLDDLLAHAAQVATQVAAQAVDRTRNPEAHEPAACHPAPPDGEVEEPPLRRLSLPQAKPPPPAVVFRPYFDARNKVISTYTCRPAPETARYLTICRPGDLIQERAVVALDHEALASAIEVYVDLYANKFRYAQTIPVHFDTLGVQRHRRDYIEQCRAIPSHLTGFLAFELLGLPVGVPHGRLAELVGMLKPFGRAVLAQLPEDTMDLYAYAQAGIKGVGTAIDPGVSDAHAAERMRMLSMAARKVGLFTYVEGVRSAAMLKAAEDAGVLYIAGPVVGPDSEVPEHIKRCTEQQMLQRKCGKGAPPQ